MQVSRKNPAVWRHLVFSPRVWLVLFLLLGWGLRLYHLGAMSVWWDESLSWDRAIHSIPVILSNTIQIQNVATQDLHPPLYFLLLHFAVMLAGTTEFALRFLSSIANLLTLAMLVPLARVLFGRRWAVYAGLTVLFAALSPFYVWYSQEARPYALVLLWSVLAVYALLRWLRAQNAGDAWRRWRWLAVFLGAVGLTLATHYLSFVLLPFFAVTLLLFDSAHGWRARLRSLPTGLAALLFAAFLVILFLMPRSGADLASWDQAGPRFVPFFIMLRDVWNSFAVGLSANLDTVALLDLFLVALWLLGIFSTIRVKRRDARLALFLASWLLVPAVAVQLGSYLRPLYLNSRHLITTSPAFYFGLALGVVALADKVSGLFLRGAARLPARRALAVVLSALVALPMLAGAVYSLNNLYFDASFAKDDHKGWAEFLRERLRPDDFLILVAPQAEKIVEYYAPKGLKWQSLPNLGETRDWQEFLDRTAVLDAYRNHGRVWFLELHQPVGDPDHHIGDLLHRYGAPTDIAYFPAIASRIILQQFEYHGPLQAPGFTVPNRTRYTFGDLFELMGYQIPAQLEPGGRLAMDLYWRVRTRTPNNLEVSLRVVDAAGNVWGQWDAPPVGGLYPVSKWRGDQVYLDRHDLVVDPGTPPGEYFIEAAVYRAAGHEPLDAKNPNDEPIGTTARLGTIQVVRPATPIHPQDLVIDRHFDVPFGDALRFVGYDVDARETNPGSAIPLTLYFQVSGQPAENVTGRVQLQAPWWQFWNRTTSATPFTLDLAGRQVGDIVQARAQARVPGEAEAGTYTLNLALDGHTPSSGLVPSDLLYLGDASVDALARSTDLPAIAHPLNARLGDSIEFLGYDVSAPSPLQPDDTLRVTLYWRALKPMDTAYKGFVHLLSKDSKVFGQKDQEPMEGARPTTSWAPGEVLSDTYEFTVNSDTPPGAYNLEIGMYNANDLVRLPTFDAEGAPTGDRLLFEELRVQ